MRCLSLDLQRVGLWFRHRSLACLAVGSLHFHGRVDWLDCELVPVFPLLVPRTVRTFH
jgi:hypothetical protein